MEPRIAGGRATTGPQILEALHVVKARPAVARAGLVAGIGIGYLLFRALDHRAISIVMAAVPLAFVGLWFLRGGEVTVRPRSKPRAVPAGLTSGINTMVAHSGGPPLATYLLPPGLSKSVYAGTTSMFFTVGISSRRRRGWFWQGPQTRCG